MIMDFILPQTDVQYKATPLDTLNIRFLGNAVPMRLLEDSQRTSTRQMEVK